MIWSERMVAAVLMALLVGVGLGVGGCTTAEYQQWDTTRTALGATDYEQALAAAQQVIRAEFGSVTVDRDRNVVAARPAYYEDTDTALSLGEKQPHRRRAEISLQRRHGQWWALIEVVHERLDTRTYGQFQQQRSGQDVSMATPMETGEYRRGGRQVWSTLRQDRDMERQLRQRLLEQLQLMPSSSASTVPADGPPSP